MNTSDLTSNSTPQTTNSTTQPLPGTGLPTLPLPGTGVTAYNAITMQQYLFQQSLASQQILAQQQAVAHAVSIKAAAEQAAARAAEISKLLKGEKDDEPKEKSQESSPKRAISESKSSSKSPSSRSSKSKSVSPVRYRTSRTGHEEHSGYRSRRHFSYYSRYDDHRDYFGPSYRRDTDRSGNRRGYLYPRRSRSRSRSRSRRRSPSRALLRRRYYHDDSRSPRRRRIRSPSPEPERRRSSRVANRRGMSKSPIIGSSLSPSPHHARITSSRKLTARRSLSSSGNSLSRCTTSPLGKDNKLDRDVSSSENNDVSAPDLRQQKKETRPLGKQLVRSESPNSSSRSRSRSRSTSTDYSGKRDTQEPRFKNTVSGKLASPDGNHSNSASSNGRSVRRASDASDDESSSGSADKIGFCQPSIKNGTVDNKHGEIGVVSGEQHKTFYDSVMGRRVNQDHMKPLRVNRLSPSPNPLSDGGQRKYSDKRKKNIVGDKYVAREMQPTKFPMDRNLMLNRHEHELSPKKISRNKGCPADSAYLEDEETSNRSKVEKDGRSHSEDAVVVEDAVNDCNCPKQGASNHEVDRFGHPNSPSECAIYPLPEAPQSMDGMLTHQKSLEKVNLERNYDVESPITLPDGAANVDTAQVSTSPNVCQYPEKKSKQGSRLRDRRRKHSRRHHKRHRKEESEEDDDNNNESRKELKLRRHERKGRKRHHKSQKERKRRKRKHRHTSSSSSADDLSASSEDGCKKDSYNVVSKRSTSSRKRRRHSPAALTSSSQ